MVENRNTNGSRSKLSKGLALLLCLWVAAAAGCHSSATPAGSDAGVKDLTVLDGVDSARHGDDGSRSLDMAADSVGSPDSSGLPADIEPQEEKINLASDSNRNGVVAFDDSDEDGEDDWSLKHGAVYLLNADDDDKDGIRDCDDDILNGVADVKDLAPILVQPMPWLEPGSTGRISSSVTDGEDPAGSFLLLVKRGEKWEAVPYEGLDLSYGELAGDGLVLGLEGRRLAGMAGWDGLVTLTLAVTGPDGVELGTDAVQLRSAPFLMASSMNPASAVLVSATPAVEPGLVEHLESLTAAPGYEFTAVGESGKPLATPVGADIWLQDAVEIGFSTLPRGADPHVIYYALKAPRGRPLDDVGRDVLLAPDVGWFEVAQPRQGTRYFDWLGNLELSPVLLANEWFHPYGKLYSGHDPDNPDWKLHPDVAAFLEIQELQGPMVYIDTGWLFNGQVSEFLAWIPYTGDPGCCGKGFRALFASPETGLELLEQWQAAGHGKAVFFGGTDKAVSIDDLLADPEFIATNQQVQGKLDGIYKQLEVDFGLVPDDFVIVPCLFVSDDEHPQYARPLTPSPLNALVLGKAYIIGDPNGPPIDGQDAFAAAIKEAIQAFDAVVEFVDLGQCPDETSDGLLRRTNTRRKPHNLEWWLWYM